MQALIPVNTIFTPHLTGTKIIGNGIAKFPESFQDGDIYCAGDYMYVYYDTETKHGWNANVIDGTKEKYHPLLSEINGCPLKYLDSSFMFCGKMKEAPFIPQTVISIINAFWGCESLVEAPIIPGSIMDMDCTFYGCTALKMAPIIPESVTSMRSVFENCSNMTGTLICNATMRTDTMSFVDHALKGTQIDRISGRCSPRMKKILMATKEKA